MLVVQVRSFFVRHRHVRRSLVTLLAVAAGATLAVQSDQLDQARRAWADRRQVWVADASLAPGEPVRAHAVELPVAAVPEMALDAPLDARLDPVDGLIAAQDIAQGEVITTLDIVTELDELAPPGWRTVAVPVGDGTVPVAPGDRVDVVADGVVLASDGIVVASEAAADAVIASAVVVVAVPAADAPSVAAAAHDQRADLLGRP